MAEDLRKTPLPGWVAKAACGRSLEEQTAAVATWGNHGAPPTLRAMTLAALELGQPAATGGHVLLFGCYRPFSTPYLLRDIVALCQHLNIDYTWLDKEYCCGAACPPNRPSRRHKAGARTTKEKPGVFLLTPPRACRLWMAMPVPSPAFKEGFFPDSPTGHAMSPESGTST